MFDGPQNDNLFGASSALEALSQLEQNTSEAVTKLRSSERLKIRTQVIIQPGNASQRHESSIKCLTGDISKGGCLILSGSPIMAGDIFWLSFSKEHLTIGSMLARCMRCRMIREDTFEVGFRFFDDVDIANAQV